MSTQNKRNSNRKDDSRTSGLSQVRYANEIVMPWEHSCRFPQEFELVALVNSADLDEIFAMFNREDEFMQLFFTKRSMSVGDVVVKPDGTAWICAPFGWLPIRVGESVDFSEHRFVKV